MGRPPRLVCVLLAFIVSVAFMNDSAARAAERGRLTATPPSGFEDLTSEREVVLDAWFGGRKLGEVRAAVKPGFVTFSDPESLARLIPDVAIVSQLAAALKGPIPANVSRACRPGRNEDCGTIEFKDAGVILDEERFSVELFVHPSLLARPDPASAHYLPAPDHPLSLVSLFGGTFSGSSQGQTSWHLQNRSIASLGGFRIRSDSSADERAGITFDNLTAESDRDDWRFLGGIFWAPGTDLVGRRRIVGLGVTTQLDTRKNKTELWGTPLELHLQQSAKVDMLVDGRIVSSRIYPSGNRMIDTSSLPDGSYDVVLKIQEDGRPVRQEQRFYTKGTSMAPQGRPLFSAFVGLLPSSSRGISVKDKTVFYQTSAAYRLTPSLGFDAAILGTQRKAILDAGLVYHSRIAQLRLAALTSTSRDQGFALRATTVGNGPMSLSFDLRKISSRDKGSLLPVTISRGSFSEDSKLGFSDRGTFSQALSTVSYHNKHATLRLTGIYRKNADEAADYSIGGSLEIPVIRSSRWDLVLLADARKTDQETSSFVGFRFLGNRGKVSVSGSGGLIRQAAKGRDTNRVVGEVQSSWHREFKNQSRLTTDVAIGQDRDGVYSRGSAHMQSRTFNSRVDVLHEFHDQNPTQFAATFDTGIVVSKDAIGLAARDMNDTGVIVSTGGGGFGQKFDVLVDEVVRGTVDNGGQLVVFLQPYRAYEIRVRSRDSHISEFDAAPRTVTLYPGNVARLDWRVTPLFILFGRAVKENGTPLADVAIGGSHGIGRTDKDGYFQIETNRSDRLRVSRKNALVCNILVTAMGINGFVSAGDQVCR